MAPRPLKPVVGDKGVPMFWCRLLALLLLAAPLLGAEQNAPAQAASPEALMPPGESRGQVNIDVKQRPFRDILQYLERVGGWNLVPMDERVGDLQITVRVTNMFWRDALEVIAIKEKLLLTEDLKSRVIYIDKPPPITMSFENTDIRTVINAVAKAGNASVIIGPNITGTVTMNLQDIPWREALDIVLKTLGYVLVEEKHGVLRVATPAELEQQMETRVFRLSYLLPRGAGYTAKMETEFATRSAAQSGGGRGDIEDTLKAVVEKVKSEKGSIAYEKRTNSVVVTDTPAKLESISNIIRQLDIPPKQVHFSLKMIELNDTDKEMLGVQWENGFTASAGGSSFATLFPFPNGTANNVLQGSGLPGDVGLGVNGATLTKAKLAPYNGVAPGITLGTLSFIDLTAALNFVKKHTTGRVIQAPELMCLDNEEATIQVGDLVRYAEADIQTTPSGGTTSGWREASRSPVKLGVQILVIPHVTGPENNILLTIIPKIESQTGAELFRVFPSSLGDLLLPQTSQRIVVTKMMLRNGETGVIGGLRNEIKGEVVTKVPLLGDIPILGWLFRSRTRPEDTNKSTNLVILITGTVIDFMERNDLKERLAPAQKQLKDIFQVYGEQ